MNEFTIRELNQIQRGHILAVREEMFRLLSKERNWDKLQEKLNWPIFLAGWNQCWAVMGELTKARLAALKQKLEETKGVRSENEKQDHETASGSDGEGIPTQE